VPQVMQTPKLISLPSAVALLPRLASSRRARLLTALRNGEIRNANTEFRISYTVSDAFDARYRVFPGVKWNLPASLWTSGRLNWSLSWLWRYPAPQIVDKALVFHGYEVHVAQEDVLALCERIEREKASGSTKLRRRPRKLTVEDVSEALLRGRTREQAKALTEAKLIRLLRADSEAKGTTISRPTAQRYVREFLDSTEA
jgi:hypothetical protein